MPNDVARRPLADDELYIERLFAAPVDLVFEMWARREHMLHWLGPKDSRCLEVDLDFRVGGAWSARVLIPEIGEARMGGVYREIVPDQRIVMTFQWRHEPAPDTVITLTFADQGGKTLQTFHQTPFETVESRDSHIGGWNGCFDNEAAYLATITRESAG